MSGAGIALTQVLAAGGTLLAEGVSDGPSDGQDLNAVTVSPGLPGFIVMFLIAVALVLLVLDMSRRVRRITARERIEERHRLEEEERQAALDAQGGAEGASAEESARDRPEGEPGGGPSPRT